MFGCILRLEVVWSMVAETRDRDRDLFGDCPWGLTPPDCIPGFTWSPNGRPSSSPVHPSTAVESHSYILDPLFMIHHTVRYPLIVITDLRA